MKDNFSGHASDYVRYRTVPFSFREIASPEFTQSLSWTYPELVGYLNTWSAVKHYTKQHATNLVSLIEPELRRAWGVAEQRTMHFPIILRAGRKR